MFKPVCMYTGTLHKALFDSYKPDAPRLVQVYDAMDALAIEAAQLRRDQELSILRDCQNIVEREADRRARRGSRGGAGCEFALRSIFGS